MENMVTDYITLENESLRLQVARTFGPRIVTLNSKGGANLLAELPDVVSERADGKIYHFYGGHRLWLAPEDLMRTYALDDAAVDVSETRDGLLVRKPVESETGIEKSLHLALAPREARLTVTHCLANRGMAPVECAPWAITQLCVGGVAILPQARIPTGLLPNRALAIWPYTNVSSPHLTWGNRFLLVRAREQLPFKVGFPNPRGWLAYWMDGTLFVKRASCDAQAHYVDFGSSSECYCNDRFIELETLGPLATLAPGSALTHTETWELHGNVGAPENEDAAQTIVDKLGLE